MNKEIVVAAYDRDLGWMEKLNSDVKKTIYRKGAKTENENEIYIDLNMGRCVHSFFNHLYLNYDNLSDYTFFVQDFPFDHWENVIDVINGDMSKLSEISSLNIGGYFGFHFNTIGNMWDMWPSQHFGGGKIIACYSNGMPQDHNPNINVDYIWNMLFTSFPPGFLVNVDQIVTLIPMYEFVPGGHFGITKDHARLRSRELYKTICDILTTNINAPWSFERLECYIFDPRFETKF